jgi:hypothetical protein
MSEIDAIYIFECKSCGYLASSRFPDKIDPEVADLGCFKCEKKESYVPVDMESLPLKLYWVETADNTEDWFMVARTEEAACVYHEDYEGFNRNDAFAKFVVVVPENVQSRPGHPSKKVIEACGGKFLRNVTPRVVELAGCEYCEGALEHAVRQRADDLFEKQGKGRPNGTKRSKKN